MNIYIILGILIVVQVYFLGEYPYIPYHMIIGFAIGWLAAEVVKIKRREKIIMPIPTGRYYSPIDSNFISITRIIAHEFSPSSQGVQNLMTLILSELQLGKLGVYELSLEKQEFNQVSYNNLASYFSTNNNWVPELFIKDTDLTWVMERLFSDNSWKRVRI